MVNLGAVIAKELGINAGQVYKAKFNVLNRLREEAEGLLSPNQFEQEATL